MNDIIPNEFSIAISIWCIKFPKNLNKTLIATIKKRSDFWSNLLIISSRDDRIWTCDNTPPSCWKIDCIYSYQIIYLCVVFVSTYLNFPPIGIKLDENCNQNVIEIYEGIKRNLKGQICDMYNFVTRIKI